ncbi:MAG: protein translocase subunit SecF [Deltaproteobacteria bacterium]|nr:protein translocase subunit SecF [Deltaproteobacteria bacterium]MBW2052597.1 protein translocase subunit SecF [Deltaproteobacteria bacterium]MBW2141237.1 protein translocase subunit SecF [Deltaproteobacteria bacterium]MBW2323619.1 protein translocase subunit SecF [Deltaproteobacteria bacterium]
MEFIKPGTNINFVGRSRLAYGLSLALILLAVISLLIHRGPNWGVDFTGGLLVQLQFKEPTSPKEIRNGLVDVEMQDSIIQSFGASDQNEFLIRTEKENIDLGGLAQKIQRSLETKYPPGSIDVRRVEMVGPKVGKDLRDKALFAVFYAILFIVIYISGRFELKWVMGIAVAASLAAAVYLSTMIGAGVTYLIIIALLVTLVVCFVFKLKYALGAIVALIHDVFITIGIFSLLNMEITLSIVAAIMTIVGYSLNDTIIVFDRIRENLKKYRRQNLDDVINTSINDCLSRTILTSGTTLTVVVCLYFLGGPVIADFAVTIIIGVLIGTYSSIYVASPVLLLWPPDVPAASKGKAKVNNRKKGKKRKS